MHHRRRDLRELFVRTTSLRLQPMTTSARLTTIVVIVGWVCLALACAATVLFPVTLGTVALSVVATAALSADRRFGPLPAALLVMLVTPYDRAANMFLPQSGTSRSGRRTRRS